MASSLRPEQLDAVVAAWRKLADPEPVCAVLLKHCTPELLAHAEAIAAAWKRCGGENDATLVARLAVSMQRTFMESIIDHMVQDQMSAAAFVIAASTHLSPAHRITLLRILYAAAVNVTAPATVPID